MTIAMPDSIFTVNLPQGYQAYLGYTDGFWPTANELPSQFPHAHLVTLTVRGGKAIGCDVESGDLTPESGCQWAADAVKAGQFRPVIYASASAMVTGIIPGLAKLNVPRSSVRLLSAHYGTGEHICGPSTCRYEQGGQVIPAMDGTQWTDQFAGVNGAGIDMSSLVDGFFGTTAEWVFGPVRALTVVNVGPASVRLSWDSPAVSAPEAVADYQVTIRKNGQDLPSYPRSEVKGTNPEAFQFGSLPPGTELEALVRAQAAGGAHSSPWTAVSFRTPVGRQGLEP